VIRRPLDSRRSYSLARCFWGEGVFLFRSAGRRVPAERRRYRRDGRDSITAQQMHSVYIEAFCVTRSSFIPSSIVTTSASAEHVGIPARKHAGNGVAPRRRSELEVHSGARHAERLDVNRVHLLCRDAVAGHRDDIASFSGNSPACAANKKPPSPRSSAPANRNVLSPMGLLITRPL